MKNFLCKSRNIVRDSYIWNIVGSTLNSFQSVLFLVLLTRLVLLGESGIFTISFAYSNLFLTIGKYGMRYYQVSDQNNDYSLIEYTKSRFVTTFAMIITTVAVIYVVAYKSNYSIRKTIIVYLVCFYRIPEAFEDVFQGNLQQNGRMDIASKSLAIRMIISLASYGFSLINTFPTDETI